MKFRMMLTSIKTLSKTAIKMMMINGMFANKTKNKARPGPITKTKKKPEQCTSHISINKQKSLVIKM